MTAKRRKRTKNTIVKINISKVWAIPKIYDKDARNAEPIQKNIREFEDKPVIFCAVRSESDKYSIQDTYLNARGIANDIGSGLEFWKWFKRYLVFGVRLEAYRNLWLSNLIGHVGTAKLVHDKCIKDVYVLDQDRFDAVGDFLRAEPYETPTLNRHLSDIVKNATTLACGTRSDKTVREISSNIVDDASRLWELLEFENDQDGWSNYYSSSSCVESYRCAPGERESLPN